LAASSTAPRYEVTDIQVLEGLEAVRRRPGMYIGSTDARGLHHLVQEVVDNSVDEALAGVCDRIEVTINADNSVTVCDNGRGIPIGPHPTQKRANGEPMNALEVVMTILHAGGKFGGGGYKVSGGLHGVGVSVVNALSEWMRVESARDGHIWAQEYVRGKPTSAVKKIGLQGTRRGTTTTFRADPQMFETVDYSFELVSERLRESAYLTKGVWITLVVVVYVHHKPSACTAWPFSTSLPSVPVMMTCTLATRVSSCALTRMVCPLWPIQPRGSISSTCG